MHVSKLTVILFISVLLISFTSVYALTYTSFWDFDEAGACMFVGIGNNSRATAYQCVGCSPTNEIFDNYDIYLKNAQALAYKLPKPQGDKNAARRIIEITTNNI